MSKAPAGLNALEGESLALEPSPSYSTFTSLRNGESSRGIDNPAFTPGAFSSSPVMNRHDVPRQHLPEAFKLVTKLPCSYSLKSDSTVSLYRARMENRNVVLRVLNGMFQWSIRISALLLIHNRWMQVNNSWWVITYTDKSKHYNYDSFNNKNKKAFISLYHEPTDYYVR